MTDRSWSDWVPWVMLGLTTVCVAVMVPLSLGHEPIDDTISYGLIALTLSGTGAFVAHHERQLRIKPLRALRPLV